MLPSLTLVHFFLSLFNSIIPYITRAIHNLPFSKLSRASQGLTLETTLHLALGTWHLALGTWHLALETTWHLALETTWHLALETPSVTRADSLLVFNEQNLSS